MRTHFPRFLDFICASTAFHQYQRKIDANGFYLAEGKDYDIARECFLKVSSNRFMIPLTINQKKIIKIFESSINLKGSVTKLHSLMNFISDRALLTNLQILASYHLLTINQTKDSWNRDIDEYSLASSQNEVINIPIGLGIRGLQHAFKRISKKVLNKDLHMHTLRHSAGTWLINQKRWDIRQVQNFLGHTRITMTEIYTHVSPQDLVNLDWGTDNTLKRS